MKTILVPTDFSDYSLYALKVAASIAKKIEAELVLVHSYVMPSKSFNNAYFYKDLNKELKRMLNKQMDELLHNECLKDIPVQKHALSNLKLWEIAIDNRYKDVDLIVMGSHGNGGFNELFIGSNTEKIVRLAGSPVLIIKQEYTDFSIKKMVFASNFFEESYTVFEKIKFFAELYDAHIELLKVISPKDFESTPVSLKLMEDFAEKFNLSNFSFNIYNSRSIEKGITDFSDEIKADLIAIETHGRTGIAHLINGSLAEDVVKHEARPVLSVKIKENPTNISGLRWYQEHIEKMGAKLEISSTTTKNTHYPGYTPA